MDGFLYLTKFRFRIVSSLESIYKVEPHLNHQPNVAFTSAII